MKTEDLQKCKCNDCDCYAMISPTGICRNCKGGIHGDKSYLEICLDEVKDLTPNSGFNVCEFDDFAPMGEKLTLYGHYDTYQEALKRKRELEARGMKIYIYPTPED